MDTLLTFKDFQTKERYLAIQNKFAIQDLRENPYIADVYTDVVDHDFEITIKEVNPITYEEEYMTKSFYIDFLFPAIDNMSKGYLLCLTKQLKNPVFLDNEKIRLYATKEKDKFNEFSEFLNKADFLNDEITVRLETQIETIIDYLTEICIHPNCNLDQKLKFKLGKGIVLVLFLMLREKKHIDAPHNIELGKFIDDNFLWWDQTEKTYKPFKRSSKVLSDYLNSNKSVKNIVDDINKLFADKSLYDFPMPGGK